MYNILFLLLLCTCTLITAATSLTAQSFECIAQDFVSPRCDTVSSFIRLGSSKSAVRKVLAKAKSMQRVTEKRDRDTDSFTDENSDVLILVSYYKNIATSVFIYIRHDMDSAGIALAAINEELTQVFGPAMQSNGYYLQTCGKRAYARKVSITDLGDEVADKYVTFALLEFPVR
jgi:hypothetical protein